MDRNAVREELLAQHEQIRADIAVCRTLAARLRGGQPVEEELDLALADLRADFEGHNLSETGWLLPLLLRHAQDDGTRGTLLAARMFEEHAAEHAAYWDQLDRPTREVAAVMDELLDELEAHMAAEERTYLSPLLLRGQELALPVPRAVPDPSD